DESSMLTQGMHKNTASLLVLLLVAAAAPARAAVSDAELTRNIQRQLSNLDYGSRRPVVAVKGGVVSIEGTVASLWLKEETINRMLKVHGIESVKSDLTIAKAENDAKLAKAVLKAMRGHSLCTG